ncbi:hypothetical protein RDWZM_006728 [Blomia tropicalis]|uniref:Conserved oligomeric Golgi complex subunit 1 n=1 Tax=Blomia tropicalis TaxID=40697 RepID=A0A9Q0RPK8_BLOTA|nr:hypothetical protein RDWZM_006728 [Blomia tropicalis]
MDSPNVEHLLQNYKVCDVIQIQKRLKTDVEKKKSDLKILIGERYNELLDATDSIDHMTISVGRLIESVKDLNVVLSEQTRIINKKDQDSTEKQLQTKSYVEATISKLLFDLPLRIWDFLASGNMVQATYNYFYGKSIYNQMDREQSNQLQWRMHQFNRMAIEDLNCYIVEYCWKSIKIESQSTEIDCSKFADICSCILLLHSDYNLVQLCEEFYSKQLDYIIKSLQEPNKCLSLLLELLLNIIMNTIKFSRVFHQEAQFEPLILQRFRKITDSVLCITNETCLLPIQYQQYKLSIDLDNQKVSKLNYQQLKLNRINEWVNSIKLEIVPILENRLKTFKSIKEIFEQIDLTEKNLFHDSNRFAEWEDYSDIIDLKTIIWQQLIKTMFEQRVYEIVQENVDLIVTELNQTLSSYNERLQNSEINLIEFVWNYQDSSFSELTSLISKSSDIVKAGFNQLYNDIEAIRMNEQYEFYLININTKLSKSLISLEQLMENLTIWEKVPIESNNGDDNSTTTIEVPIQISLNLYEALRSICSDINKYCAYSMSRPVLIHLVSLIIGNVLKHYQLMVESIQTTQSIYPDTAKQTISVQLYFDLFFLKNLFSTIKDEQLRQNQFTKMNQLLSQLENLIDPFDLHIMFPWIKLNSDKLFRSCFIIFGFILTDRPSIGIKVTHLKP